MSNAELNQSQQKSRFSVAITTPQYHQMITNTLRDPDRANRFVASITSAVAVNPALQECKASSILAGALLGESLGLSPSPQLGQYYLVPFNVKLKDENGRQRKDRNGQPMTEKQAQFVLGYKGYIQLAIRSGQYKKINVIEIKQGELQHFDPLNEDIDCMLIEDWDTREAAPTTGYYAMFEYVNGFRKALYWSKEKMLSHADKFSPAFSAAAYKKIQAGEIPDKDLWKYSSFWYKDFDSMAKKTMLRQILGHWGVVSIDMQKAYEEDGGMADFHPGSSLPEVTAPETELLPEPHEPQTETESEELEPEPEGGKESDEPEQVNLDDL